MYAVQTPKFVCFCHKISWNKSCVNVTYTDSLCIPRINYFLLPSAGELGVIFIPSKLHLKALNTFPRACPSWYCVRVFTLLSFHTT